MAIENTKQAILETALKLFSENGFNGTSIRQIVERVGIKGSSLYNHFKSKDEILSTLIDEYNPDAIKERIGANEEQVLADPYSQLVKITEEIIHFLESPHHQKFARLILMELSHDKGKSKKLLQDLSLTIEERIVELFSKLIENKKIKNLDPVFLAGEFITPLVFMLFKHIALYNENNEEKIKDIEETKRVFKQHTKFFWDNIKL